MNDQPPLPDLIGSRSQQDDVVGAPEQSTMSFEEAIAMHPDVGQVWLKARAAYELVIKENNELAAAAAANIAVPPNAQHRLHAINMALCRELDGVIRLLDKETNQVRAELFRAIYGNLSPIWQSMVLQTHMARATMRSPGQIHEMLMTEATILLERAQRG